MNDQTTKSDGEKRSPRSSNELITTFMLHFDLLLGRRRQEDLTAIKKMLDLIRRVCTV